MKKLVALLALALSAHLASAETIAYWPFGANGLKDVSGHGYDLESDGEHVVLDAENGVTLDGLQTLFSTIKGIDLGTAEAVTLEFWTKFDRATTIANSSPAIIFELSPDFGGSDYAFLVDYNDFSGTMLGAWKVYGGWQMTTQQGDTTGDGNWHHIALVLNPKAAGNASTKLYVDGVAFEGGTQYNTQPQTTVNWPKGQKAYIGTRNNSQYKFKGQIDDVKISTGALTPGFFVDRSSGAAASPEKKPAFGTIRATAATETSVTLTGRVEALGAGATSAKVEVVRDGEATEIAQLTEPGAFTYTLDGLTKGETREVEFRLTNNLVDDAVSQKAIAQTVREESTTIAYYSFDDEDFVVGGAGNGLDRLADKSGHENWLWTSGVTVQGGSARLSGSQTYFQASDWKYGRVDHAPYTTDWRNRLTVELWAKFADDVNGEMMLVETSSGSGENGQSYNIYYTPGAIVATVGHESWTYSQCSAPFTPDGAWHHLALVVNPAPLASGYDASVGQLTCGELYIDGVMKATMPWRYQPYGDGLYYSIHIGNQTFFVGCRNNTRMQFAGEIDDVRITGGALVPAQFVTRTPIEDVSYPQPVLDAVRTMVVEESSVAMNVKLSSIGDGATYCDLVVTYEKGGETIRQTIGRVTEPTTVDFTVEGLDESTDYTFTVIATNDVYENEVKIERAVTTRQAPKALLSYKFSPKDVTAEGLIVDRGALGVKLQTSGTVTVNGAATVDGESSIWNATGFTYGDINVLTAECFAKFTVEDNPDAGMLVGGSGEPGYNPGTFHLYYVGDAKQVRGTICFQGNWDQSTMSADFTPDGNWHHFAMVINPDEESGKAAALYIDYQKVAEMNWPKNGDTYKAFGFGSSSFSIGSVYNDSRYYLKGQVDDVRIYNRALAPEQFQQKRDKGYQAVAIFLR